MSDAEERQPSQGDGGRNDPEWPTHFPPGCPPTDADSLSGIVYMLVSASPPTPKDMECAMDRDVFKDGPPCERASLSCARNSSHLVQLRSNSKRLRNHVVAVATFQPEHGKIKPTRGPGHYSMWLRAKYLKIGYTMFTVQP